MRAVGGLVARLLVASAFAGWCLPSHALRPYDGTDAAVAAPSEFELELGYFGYAREGTQRAILAPAAVLNFGLSHGTELVIEGRLRNRLNPDPGVTRHNLEGAAISIKQIHRDGVMQEQDGPSIASECGVLAPTATSESWGASCAGITSLRRQDVTTHINLAAALNREKHGEYFASLIVEGPKLAIVRPVLETSLMRESTGAHIESILVGLLWPLRENLGFDIAVRKARDQGANITELRAGFTWIPASHP